MGWIDEGDINCLPVTEEGLPISLSLAASKLFINENHQVKLTILY